MIAKDKIGHFLAGFWISMLFNILSVPVVGLFVSGLAGVGKEIYDKNNNGSAEVADAVATLCGGCFAYLIRRV